MTADRQEIANAVRMAYQNGTLSLISAEIMMTLCASMVYPDGTVSASRRVLAHRTGYGPSTVWSHLRQLVADGWLVRTGQLREQAAVYRLRIPGPCPAPGCRAPDEHEGLHDIPAGQLQQSGVGS